MRFNMKEVFGFLQLFADAQAHKFIDQYGMYRALHKKDMIHIARYAMHNQWIKGVGRDFLHKPLALRHFVLAEKGDDLFRHISIKQGGDEQFYKYYDRDPNNERWSDDVASGNIRGAQLN